MKIEPRNRALEKQLQAEIQRILQLLERTRRTRRQVRLLVALDARASRRRMPLPFRAVRPRG